MERRSSLLSPRRIWGFWAFWNCTNNNKHAVWCPLGTIQWIWCKMSFFIFGCLHVFIKFRVHKLRGEQLIIFKLFMQFFHPSAINRQRVGLTTLPTSQGRKAKALFLNVTEHILLIVQKINTGCNYNALKHRSRFYRVCILKFLYSV